MTYKKDISTGFNSISQRNTNDFHPVTSPDAARRIVAENGMKSFSITLPKKCERLATAIYLVTNFLSDTEPLKTRLRVLSIDFVRDASLVKGAGRETETSVLNALRANIEEVLSLLELALVAGLVSEMNFTLLKREYISLREMIDMKKASRESLTDNVLGDDFFGSSFHTEENIPPTVPMPHLNSASSLRGSTLTKQSSAPASNVFASTRSNPGNIDRHEGSSSHNEKMDTSVSSKMSDNKTKGHAPVVADFAKSHLNQQIHVLDAAMSVEAGSSKQSRDFASHARATTDDAKEARRARILNLIKDNREVAIRDIVAHFHDVSEKTIQRELVAMSDSGILKKTGERRWSRYALA